MYDTVQQPLLLLTTLPLLPGSHVDKHAPLILRLVLVALSRYDHGKRLGFASFACFSSELRFGFLLVA